jgi:hypothetical protein
MMDAKDAVGDAKKRLEDAEKSTTIARKACEEAFAALGEAKLHAMQGALLPFHGAFSRLKNVDFHSEVGRLGAPALDEIAVKEAGRLTVDVASALGVGAVGYGVGAASGAGAAAAVSGLAAASTGTAISSISGVAATNATLAWLGGGTLASGGGGVAAGGALLSGVAAAPILVVGGIFLHHKGREALAKAETFSADVKTAQAKHRESQAVLRGAASEAQMVRTVLESLTPMVASGSGWLDGVVSVQPDWREFDDAGKDTVRRLAALAMATSELVHTPLMSEDGAITKAIRDAVGRGRTLLG